MVSIRRSWPKIPVMCATIVSPVGEPRGYLNMVADDNPTEMFNASGYREGRTHSGGDAERSARGQDRKGSEIRILLEKVGRAGGRPCPTH